MRLLVGRRGWGPVGVCKYVWVGLGTRVGVRGGSGGFVEERGRVGGQRRDGRKKKVGS